MLQCTGSINTDELIRIVDDRAVRSVVSTGFGFNVIALEKTVLSYSHEGIKNEPPPSSNGKRFGSKNGNMSFLTVSICNSRKKVKRDFVMNVEITE